MNIGHSCKTVTATDRLSPGLVTARNWLNPTGRRHWRTVYGEPKQLVVLVGGGGGGV